MKLVLVLFKKEIQKADIEKILQENGEQWAQLFNDNDLLYGVRVKDELANLQKEWLLQLPEVELCELVKAVSLIRDVVV